MPTARRTRHTSIQVTSILQRNQTIPTQLEVFMAGQFDLLQE